MSIITLNARKIGADDISWGLKSFTYHDPWGVTRTMPQVNASSIPYLVGVSIADYLDDLNELAIIVTNTTEFYAAITTLGSTPGTIFLAPGTYDISSDPAIPANVQLWFGNEAILQIANGITATINGPISAGPYQIFSYVGTGKVANDCLAEGYPEWWGAVGDDSTDDTAAINYCTAAARKTQLLDKTYKTTIPIILPEKHEITGNGDLSVIHQATAGTATTYNPQISGAFGIVCKDYAKVSNFCLKGTYDKNTIDSNSRGIAWYEFTGAAWATRSASEFTGNYVTVENMTIQDWGCDGVCGASYWMVRDCRISHCYLEGILFQGSYGQATNNDISDLYSWGVDLNGSENIVQENRISNVGQASLPGGYQYDGGGIVAASQTANLGLSGNQITSNIINGTGECRGIYLYHNLAWAVKDNTISENTVTSTANDNSVHQGIIVQAGATGAGYLKGVQVNNNTVRGFGSEGMYLQNISNLNVTGNILTDCGATHAGSLIGIHILSCNNFEIAHNVVTLTTLTASTYGINGEDSTQDAGQIINNNIKNYAVGIQGNFTSYTNISINGNDLTSCTLAINSLNLSATNNLNDNVGVTNNYYTAVALPGSTTAYQNPYCRDCLVTISGGTVTVIALGPASGTMTATGLTSGTFYVPANGWIKLTYTVDPTWVWYEVR